MSDQSLALVALEPCGCTAAITVLTGHENTAYADAAKWIKEDRTNVVQMTIGDWRKRGFRCAEHPKGPPWWKSNGGNGKRPPEYQPPAGAQPVNPRDTDFLDVTDWRLPASIPSSWRRRHRAGSAGPGDCCSGVGLAPVDVKVLIGCEFSGVVRAAFRERGYDAWSCDLLPAEDGSPFHIQDDVTRHLGDGWQLAIFHPPCKYLANSGARWLYGGKGTVRDPQRWADMEDAARFFRLLLDAPIPRIAVENPIMHGHAGIRPPDQWIQPWQFGHPETKQTGLWLQGLPLLVPTNIVEGREPRVHYASPGPNRWKVRSRTLPGPAAAFADQWGSLLIEQVA